MSVRVMRRHRGAILASATLAFGLVLTGCSSDDSEPTPEPETTTNAEEPEEEDTRATVAHALDMDEITIYEEPSEDDASADDTDVDDVLEATDYLQSAGDTPMVFLVNEERGDWLHVDLPIRPNGTQGWLHAGDVEIKRSPFHFEISLGDHNLKLYENDEVVLDEDIGVGTEDTPTPPGTYYIKELLQPPNPDGVYGTYAYGLSGYSDVIEEFEGGPGDLAIHGTNNPDGIGTDVSHGCMRMTNDNIDKLVEDYGLPLGTPVEVTE